MRRATSSGSWATAVAMVVLLVGSLAAVGVGGVAAASGSGDATGAIQFGYVSASDGHVTLVTADGSRIDTGVSAAVVGKGGDLDGDGYVEIPYVTGQQTLGVVDRTGERVQLADAAEETKTTMAVGDLDGDGTPALYYARDSSTAGSELRRAYDNGTTEVVVSKDTTANAALGVADVTGDGVPEVVFVGSSGGLRYYNETASDVVTFYTSGIGSNGGLGVGAPRDFDGDGVARVPIVDGSNNAVLVEPVGTDANVTTVVSGGVDKNPVAGVDWTSDDGIEYLYVDGDAVKWATLDGTGGTVTDANGNAISTTSNAGVAWMETPLDVSNVTLTSTNESGPLAFSFEASEELRSVDATVTGPNGSERAFTLDDFDANASGGTWTYDATYAPEADGNYTATVSSATATDGGTWTAGESDDATITEPFDVRDLNATAEPDQRLAISFDATETLGSVAVDVSGPSNATLDRSNFSTDDGAAPYTYTGGYDAETGGNYTVTLTQATSTDGRVDDDSLDANATLPTFEVFNATLNATGDGGLRAAFDATQPVSSASLTLDGPTTNATLDFADFTRVGDDPARYAATVNESRDGNYTFTVSAATSEGSIGWRGDASANATVDARRPLVVNATLADATDANGVVNATGRVRVTANVSGDVAGVRADLGAFDAGTVALDSVGDDTYRATAEVGNATAVADGNANATVHARDGQGNTASTRTNDVTVDTTPPTVALGSARNVTVNTTVSFAPETASDAETRIVAYAWTFGDGANASGASVSHRYDETGNETVVLAATDAAGNVGTASLAVTVSENETSTTNETNTTNETSTTNETTTTTTNETTTTTDETTTTTDETTTTTDETTTTTDETTTTTAEATTTDGGGGGGGGGDGGYVDDDDGGYVPDYITEAESSADDDGTTARSSDPVTTDTTSTSSRTSTTSERTDTTTTETSTAAEPVTGTSGRADTGGSSGDAGTSTQDTTTGGTATTSASTPGLTVVVALSASGIAVLLGFVVVLRRRRE
ncbi:hypothetical protein J2752_001890 [Halarchaeum rubridurum]|uniref:PKD domain-containing protein n=1 Tax=Halarchaeum rubridurum TaxID=489911 RepID=A0A8T4GNS6_9EURY|nr:PKD domain-containing protein [Halarchaeum rubridurum]MBP1954978.1 hypothetical protein [Halarchaeum rubridurum]